MSDRISTTENSAATKVLLVEDSPTQLEHLRIILQEDGCEVITATNGKDALEIARNSEPDIILSDIVMPKMDGYELCHAIKSDANLASTPVVLLTSLSSSDDVVKGLACGADQFLTKPVDEDFLLARLRATETNQKIRAEGAVSDIGVQVAFGGNTYEIKADRIQILDLLLSTYENAVLKARELERTNAELRDALETINTIRELVPICCQCHKIRDDEGYWEKLETFLSRNSKTQFSHGYCPQCAREMARASGFELSDAEAGGRHSDNLSLPS